MAPSLDLTVRAPFLTVAGIVLAAPPGRSVGEVLLSQLALQAACTNAGAASARSV